MKKWLIGAVVLVAVVLVGANVVLAWFAQHGVQKTLGAYGVGYEEVECAGVYPKVRCAVSGARYQGVLVETVTFFHAPSLRNIQARSQGAYPFAVEANGVRLEEPNQAWVFLLNLLSKGAFAKTWPTVEALMLSPDAKVRFEGTVVFEEKQLQSFEHVSLSVTNAFGTMRAGVSGFYENGNPRFTAFDALVSVVSLRNAVETFYRLVKETDEVEPGLFDAFVRRGLLWIEEEEMVTGDPVVRQALRAVKSALEEKSKKIWLRASTRNSQGLDWHGLSTATTDDLHVRIGN